MGWRQRHINTLRGKKTPNPFPKIGHEAGLGEVTDNTINIKIMNKPIPKGEVIKGNVLKNVDNNYINAVTLLSIMEETGKKEITLVMDRVEYHSSLTYSNGQTKAKVNLLYFQPIEGWEFSKRPLDLNTTNLNAIVLMFGAIGSNWEGKKIKLITEMARNPKLGVKAPAVRVKVEARKGF